MKTLLKLLIAQLIVFAQLFAAPGTVLAQGDGAPHPDTTARATLAVKGMIGDACPVLIESALRRVIGVRHVEASYAEHKATVDYDPQRVSLDQIRTTIRHNAGFDTEPAN